ncbi:MAG TPA: isoprenylcysteine carboxylmethyltransferase family protein [Candidatus Dormibacteraeota bacterium]|nr:isoprenylcysteine carboxylmethyltransferase family protein [Candidatus Dormibacteraeota bacterium]
MVDLISQLFGTTPNGPIFLALAIIWGFFAAYWACAFFYDITTGREKPEVKSGGSLVHEIVPRLLIFLAVVGIVAPEFRSVLVERLPPGPNIISFIGVGIAAFGSLFAIWARNYLGGNWGPKIGLKKGHTLVRSGPYAIVRHPIYTGVGFGMVGSVIALENAFGIVVLVGVLLMLFFRMDDEEKIMVEKFGKEYLEYEKEVRRFVPFLY